jgi:spore germination protein YaaH
MSILTKWTFVLAAAPLLGSLACAGCAGTSTTSSAGETDILASSGPIPRRSTSVEIDGCSTDSWQNETLAASATRAVVSEVILMCLAPREDGTIAPGDPSARAALAGTIQTLHELGYSVRLGVSFVDETGARFDGVQSASWLASETWRDAVITDIVGFAPDCDGFDLDVERLPDDARDSLDTFVGDLSTSLQPSGKRVGIFVLPSTQSPSDVSGGNAFDLPVLAQYVDRLRVATLDFSVGTPGPTLDSGWAVDAVRFAQGQVSAATSALPIYDIAAPLYGWDFSSNTQRSITWLEATGLAQTYGVTPQRMAGGEEQFFYTDEYAVQHTVVYDDASSTTTFLHAWDTSTLPASVGVVLWGFGAEDPETFASIAGALP